MILHVYVPKLELVSSANQNTTRGGAEARRGGRSRRRSARLRAGSAWSILLAFCAVGGDASLTGIVGPACAILGVFLLLLAAPAAAQDNYEIQVYGAETVAPRHTMVELHSNFTIQVSKTVQDGVL